MIFNRLRCFVQFRGSFRIRLLVPITVLLLAVSTASTVGMIVNQDIILTANARAQARILLTSFLNNIEFYLAAGNFKGIEEQASKLFENRAILEVVVAPVSSEVVDLAESGSGGKGHSTPDPIIRVRSRDRKGLGTRPPRKKDLTRRTAALDRPKELTCIPGPDGQNLVLSSVAYLKELDRIGGTVHLTYSLEGVRRQRTAALHTSIILGFMIFILGSTACYLLGTHMINPLKQLERASQKIAEGHYDMQIQVRSRDEFGRLAMSFNRMVEAVRDSRRQIEEHNQTLERTVQERTRRLEEALKKLLHLDQLKDAFLSSVSHELRTPLTSIRSFSEILLTYDEDAETRREFLEIIHKESERLTRLINDVLDLSKIESGRIHWNLEEQDPGPVIEEAVHAIQGMVKAQDIQLVYTQSKSLPLVVLDRDRIIQVVINLLSNAIKFSDVGGRIELRVLGGDREGKKGIFLSVTDFGCGIPAENHNEVFEKFKQMGDTLVSKPEGTGLGLPISKEIVNRHGGAIWVESETGQGSIFHVFLPCQPPPHDSSSPESGIGLPDCCEVQQENAETDVARIVDFDNGRNASP